MRLARDGSRDEALLTEKVVDDALNERVNLLRVLQSRTESASRARKVEERKRAYLKLDHPLLGLQRHVHRAQWRNEVEEENGESLGALLGALARGFGARRNGLLLRGGGSERSYEMRGGVAGEGGLREAVVNELVQRRGSQGARVDDCE